MRRTQMKTFLFDTPGDARTAAMAVRFVSGADVEIEMFDPDPGFSLTISPESADIMNRQRKYLEQILVDNLWLLWQPKEDVGVVPLSEWQVLSYDDNDPMNAPTERGQTKYRLVKLTRPGGEYAVAKQVRYTDGRVSFEVI